MASKESISNLVIILMFLVALWRILRQHDILVRIHMGRCNESLQHNTNAVTNNTIHTARVVDALNQIAMRMPNFGCSQHVNDKLATVYPDNAAQKVEVKGEF